MAGPFRRRADGIHLRLRGSDVEVLEMLPSLLEGLGDPADDPAAARLNPGAYPEDEEADREFRRLSGPELERGRSEDRSAFLEAVAEGREGTVLDEARAESILRVVGEARLAVAARLGIEEEGWEASDDAGVAFLQYLSWFQEELVEALTDEEAG